MIYTLGIFGRFELELSDLLFSSYKINKRPILYIRSNEDLNSKFSFTDDNISFSTAFDVHLLNTTLPTTPFIKNHNVQTDCHFSSKIKDFKMAKKRTFYKI